MTARRPPAERVRDRLRAAAGPAAALAMPAGYQRLGHVLALRLPPALRPHFPLLGRAWCEELGVSTVIVRTGAIEGELRTPRVEIIAGIETETEVVEHGVRWRFDAARLMFAAGNRSERQRIRRLVRPGERVVDLFAGIGYFAIPAALANSPGPVLAVEKNPIAHRYLVENARRNGVGSRLDARLGDNRSVPLPPGAADRIVLGYLPSAVPWIPVALPLVRPTGGTLHVHLVADARTAATAPGLEVRRAVEATGGSVAGVLRSRAVKAYGPGRTHVVVDVGVVP